MLRPVNNSMKLANPGISATLGRVAGQIIATAPLIEAGGAGLGVLGSAVVDALPSLGAAASPAFATHPQFREFCCPAAAISH
jgi:hypothetical protein